MATNPTILLALTQFKERIVNQLSSGSTVHFKVITERQDRLKFFSDDIDKLIDSSKHNCLSLTSNSTKRLNEINKLILDRVSLPRRFILTDELVPENKLQVKHLLISKDNPNFDNFIRSIDTSVVESLITQIADCDDKLLEILGNSELKELTIINNGSSDHFEEFIDKLDTNNLKTLEVVFSTNTQLGQIIERKLNDVTHLKVDNLKHINLSRFSKLSKLSLFDVNQQVEINEELDLLEVNCSLTLVPNILDNLRLNQIPKTVQIGVYRFTIEHLDT